MKELNWLGTKLNLFLSTLAGNFTESRMKFSNLECECRNKCNIISIWARNNLSSNAHTSLLNLLIKKITPKIERLTLGGIFDDASNETQNLVDTCNDGDIQSLLTTIKGKNNQNIESIEKTLMQYVFNKEDIKQHSIRTLVKNNAQLNSFFLDFSYRSFHDLIDAFGLYEISQAEVNDTCALFVGYVHARNIGEYLTSIGYKLEENQSYGYHDDNSSFMSHVRSVSQIISPDCLKPLLNQDIPRCNTCGKNNSKLLRCGRCKQVYYCSAACQKKDWRDHKHVCKKLEEKKEP
jgi:hypothetical protein